MNQKISCFQNYSLKTFSIINMWTYSNSPEKKIGNFLLFELIRPSNSPLYFLF